MNKKTLRKLTLFGHHWNRAILKKRVKKDGIQLSDLGNHRLSNKGMGTSPGQQSRAPFLAFCVLGICAKYPGP